MRKFVINCILWGIMLLMGASFGALCILAWLPEKEVNKATIELRKSVFGG